MFSVDHVLLSDDLLDAPFACSLRACLGGCCVQGESGAPLRADELGDLEAALPAVLPLLTDEGRAVLHARGAWEETSPGVFHTTCVEEGGRSGQCTFVTVERGIAKCALEKTFYAGGQAFVKPVSCHLYPLRIQEIGDLDVVNYERIDLCSPAVSCGARAGVQLADFLAVPLTRRYGADWYARFQTALAERRASL